jgi:DNA polymerase-3 subunit delta
MSGFDSVAAAKFRVVLLHGEESILMRRALDQLIEASGVAPDDMEMETFVGDSMPPKEWIATAGTVPFLAERRVVVVRNVGRADAEEVNVDSLRGLPETALLILVGDEEAGADDRKSKSGTNLRNFAKLVKDAKGGVYEFKADSKTAAGFVKVEVEKLGKTISAPAANLLVEMTGGSAGRALQEVEKLVLYASGDRISEREIKDVVVPSREWNVFNLIDAAISGNVGVALRQLQTVLTNKSKVEDLAFANIFPLFARQFRLLWQARAHLENGTSPDSPNSEMAQLYTGKSALSSQSDFVKNGAMRQAKQVTFEGLVRAMALLEETDGKLKGQGASYSAVDTLEQFLIRLSRELKAA